MNSQITMASGASKAMGTSGAADRTDDSGETKKMIARVAQTEKTPALPQSRGSW